MKEALVFYYLFVVVVVVVVSLQYTNEYELLYSRTKTVTTLDNLLLIIQCSGSLVLQK